MQNWTTLALIYPGEPAWWEHVTMDVKTMTLTIKLGNDHQRWTLKTFPLPLYVYVGVQMHMCAHVSMCCFSGVVCLFLHFSSCICMWWWLCVWMYVCVFVFKCDGCMCIHVEARDWCRGSSLTTVPRISLRKGLSVIKLRACLNSQLAFLHFSFLKLQPQAS